MRIRRSYSLVQLVQGYQHLAHTALLTIIRCAGLRQVWMSAQLSQPQTVVCAWPWRSKLVSWGPQMQSACRFAIWRGCTKINSCLFAAGKQVCLRIHV